MINITNMMMISTKLKNFTAATILTKVTEAFTNLSESPATALVSWRWGGGSDSFS